MAFFFASEFWMNSRVILWLLRSRHRVLWTREAPGQSPSSQGRDGPARPYTRTFLVVS